MCRCASSSDILILDRSNLWPIRTAGKRHLGVNAVVWVSSVPQRCEADCSSSRRGLPPHSWRSCVSQRRAARSSWALSGAVSLLSHCFLNCPQRLPAADQAGPSKPLHRGPSPDRFPPQSRQVNGTADWILPRRIPDYPRSPPRGEAWALMTNPTKCDTHKPQRACSATQLGCNGSPGGFRGEIVGEAAGVIVWGRRRPLRSQTRKWGFIHAHLSLLTDSRSAHHTPLQTSPTCARLRMDASRISTNNRVFSR